MVSLSQKQTRDDIGIDTFERAIIWSAFHLRGANTSINNPIPKAENPYYNAVRISKQDNQQGETATTVLNISAKFPYEWSSFLGNMGELFNTVKEIAPWEYSLTTTPVNSSTGSYVLIETEPPEIDTLEKYFVWAAIRLSKYLYPSLTNIKYRFLEEDPQEPSLVIDVTLPYDFIKYCDTRNYLESVKAVARKFANTNSDFSNDSQVGNDSIVGN